MNRRTARQTTRLIPLLTVALLGLATLTVHADPVVETVHLVVTGGPNAGTWDGSEERGGCSAGMTGPGSWGNQFSLPKEKDPAKFNSLQLIVPDAKKAASGTKEFLILFRFGPLIGKNTEYNIETRPAEAKKKGSGSVTVDDRGATAKVSFNVTSGEGYKFEGTIDCKSIIRGS
ncbi:hypothetical protein [Candidatus Aalborgicola defluviihabitans]|uniref:hypothetical protein n=1 Tax=Candidatus Aalborgicola defluviihabitans TaxID=3386187 RepID=UPI00390A4D4B|nr:hypothetical protein [Burkholderiales bacterium]